MKCCLTNFISGFNFQYSQWKSCHIPMKYTHEVHTLKVHMKIYTTCTTHEIYTTHAHEVCIYTLTVHMGCIFLLLKEQLPVASIRENTSVHLAEMLHSGHWLELCN